MALINGNCLEVMKDISDNSIDLLFCDLPYGQTSCKWDCLIDLELFWKQVNRICKDDTAMFFTCSTKFGVSLINSNPKNFRYDLVWVKSSPCGFLNAKKMPMKKHEMVYVFYKKLPKIYTDNIAEHHTHKFIKETANKRKGKDGTENRAYMNRSKTEISNKYDPPLPTSVIKDEKTMNTLYGELKPNGYFNKRNKKTGMTAYDPPLPTSVIKNDDYENRIIKERNTIKKEENYGKEYLNKKENFRAYNPKLGAKGEDGFLYEPPLPTSIIKEEKTQISKCKDKDLYGDMKGGTIGNVHGTNYEPSLPTSVIKDEGSESIYGKMHHDHHQYASRVARDSVYDPPLPNTILEIASQKGKHSTQKPVDLIKWCLKYYSKEGDTILDPTMGSGSTGVACNEMNRKFIGIEMDETIFKVAEKRVNV